LVLPQKFDLGILGPIIEGAKDETLGGLTRLDEPARKILFAKEGIHALVGMMSRYKLEWKNGQQGGKEDQEHTKGGHKAFHIPKMGHEGGLERRIVVWIQMHGIQKEGCFAVICHLNKDGLYASFGKGSTKIALGRPL